MRPSRLSVLGGIAIVLSIGAPSHALTFNFDYSDGTVAAQFGGNFVNFQAAANRAAVNFTSVFNDNININIKMSADNSGSVLGQSSQFLFSSAYSDIRAAMVADATTAGAPTTIYLAVAVIYLAMTLPLTGNCPAAGEVRVRGRG